MATLFIYGTLLDPKICESVLSRPVDPAHVTPATAMDYAIYRVANVSYPCLLPEKGASAQGALVSGLTETDLAKLDLFEGVNYQRAPLVIVCDQQEVSTHYYKPNHRLKTDGPWDLASWQKQGKKAFLSHDFDLSGVRPPDDE